MCLVCVVGWRVLLMCGVVFNVYVWLLCVAECVFDDRYCVSVVIAVDGWCSLVWVGVLLFVLFVCVVWCVLLWLVCVVVALLALCVVCVVVVWLVCCLVVHVVVPCVLMCGACWLLLVCV